MTPVREPGNCGTTPRRRIVRGGVSACLWLGLLAPTMAAAALVPTSSSSSITTQSVRTRASLAPWTVRDPCRSATPSSLPIAVASSSSTTLWAARSKTPPRSNNNNNSKSSNKRRPNDPTTSPKSRRHAKPASKQKQMTIAELQSRILQNPARYNVVSSDRAVPKNRKKNRNRQRDGSPPQQTYLYAPQRRRLQLLQQQQQQQQVEETPSSSSSSLRTNQFRLAAATSADEVDDGLPLLLRRPLATHGCDPVPGETPQLVGRLLVDDSSSSSTDESASSSAAASAYAYLIHKPAGWALLGSKPPANPNKNNKNKNKKNNQPNHKDASRGPYQPNAQTTSKNTAAEAAAPPTNHDELTAALAEIMTPEEFQEFLAETGGVLPDELVALEESNSDNNNYSSGEPVTITGGAATTTTTTRTPPANEERDESTLDPRTRANLRRIRARTAESSTTVAQFPWVPRPAVLQWLKEAVRTTYGQPIRGGNYWKAVAGATHVDDSGLVVVCPKAHVHNLFVDAVEYVAVLGNGATNPLDDVSPLDNSAPSRTTSSSSSSSSSSVFEDQQVDFVPLSKLRKGRGGVDTVQSVRVTISGTNPSTCETAARECQDAYNEQIRGDPALSLERRAGRRLVHCSRMACSSLVHDESTTAEAPLPDDMALWSDRKEVARGASHKQFRQGSYLGRARSLARSNITNAYREMNGAADGFPGWTVDRYGRWLLVQHDPAFPQGPLPSIHDGYTAGVYYLETPSHGSGGGGPVPSTATALDRKPRLLEGQPAPPLFDIQENGISYAVSLDRDLSTGVFLDQRPQRAWLARHCGPDTRVLNCFAHTGAFSVAAATAGAATVSVDLSAKWLDRLPQHFAANGLEFDERHDAIYGDCFYWLGRLAKRGEKYDIVILDPPSSSVGEKKKRWSIRNDMPELVALAAQLVKPRGGYLWTTTNSASLSALQFARLCRKGLEQAGCSKAKLDRIQPMPHDFPSIGPQPVKNLIWRF